MNRAAAAQHGHGGPRLIGLEGAQRHVHQSTVRLFALAAAAAAAAVLGAEVAVCGVLTAVILRALRPLTVPGRHRRAA